MLIEPIDLVVTGGWLQTELCFENQEKGVMCVSGILACGCQRMRWTTTKILEHPCTDPPLWAPLPWPALE